MGLASRGATDWLWASAGRGVGVEVVLMRGVSAWVLTAVLMCAACGGADSGQAGNVTPRPRWGIAITHPTVWG